MTKKRQRKERAETILVDAVAVVITAASALAGDEDTASEQYDRGAEILKQLGAGPAQAPGALAELRRRLRYHSRAPGGRVRQFAAYERLSGVTSACFARNQGRIEALEERLAASLGAALIDARDLRWELSQSADYLERRDLAEAARLFCVTIAGMRESALERSDLPRRALDCAMQISKQFREIAAYDSLCDWRNAKEYRAWHKRSDDPR